MSGGYPQLDYPFVAARSATSAAATKVLLSALQSDAADKIRSQQGLLNPGATSVDRGSYPGVSSGALVPVPAVDEIPTLYAVADAGAQHGNILAVLDVSGSMAEPAQGAGGETKMQVVQNSAALAMQLLAGESRVGLWEFGLPARAAGRLRPDSADRGSRLQPQPTARRGERGPGTPQERHQPLQDGARRVPET